MLGQFLSVCLLHVIDQRCFRLFAYVNFINCSQLQPGMLKDTRVILYTLYVRSQKYNHPLRKFRK
jgi:hypothetical protein